MSEFNPHHYFETCHFHCFTKSRGTHSYIDYLSYQFFVIRPSGFVNEFMFPQNFPDRIAVSRFQYFFRLDFGWIGEFHNLLDLLC